MRVSRAFVEPPSRCAYLPDRDSRMEYRVAVELDEADYAALMLRGWRHFGRTLFRPRCVGCDACQPIRIDVARFRPDRSQRRARKANQADLRLEVAEPSSGPDQLALYHRYHAHQQSAKDWPDRAGEGPFEYHQTFVDNPFPVQEWRYFLGDELVGVGYVDVLPVGLSAITFLHDPAHRERSLGTWNVLAMIDRATLMGLPHVYLGYYIADCRSMAYKARFVPNQTLQADGHWAEFRP